MQEQFVALATMAEGAVIERFSEEFQLAIENITDVNTDPKAKRKITIVIELQGNEHRNFADARISVFSKLAAHLPTLASFRIGKLGSRVEATEIPAVAQPSFLPASAEVSR